MKIALVFVLALAPFFLFSQSSVMGKVAGADGNAMRGVTVAAKGTNAGTATDGTGAYKLSIPQNQSVEAIVFTMKGAKPYEVELPAGASDEVEIYVVLDAKKKNIRHVLIL